MRDCVFCNIVEGRIPCYKVFENEKFLAFLDINPRNPGHTLVIPKEHFRWVWDVPYLGEYYELVGKIAGAIRKVMKTEWVISLVLGEEVPHAHVWLVPRLPNDGHGGSIVLSNIKKISKEEMEEIASSLREKLHEKGI